MITTTFRNTRILFLGISLLILGCSNPKPIKGAVVSAREEASAIGVAIMKQGGTAFDAMIATDLALTVCYPNAGNISGGGFAVYRTNEGEIGSLIFVKKPLWELLQICTLTKRAMSFQIKAL